MGLKKYKEKLILFGGTIGIGLVSLAITLTVYNVQISDMKKTDDIKLDENDKDEIVFNTELTDAQKVVAQNLIEELEKLEKESEKNNAGDVATGEKDERMIEEIKRQEENARNEREDYNDENVMEDESNDVGDDRKNDESYYVNINNPMKNESEDSTINTASNNNIENNIVETIAPIKNEMSFIRPVDGTLGMIFSDEKLVYSKTLEEWITHKALDFLAPVDTIVKASADGTVTDLSDDKKYGFTITIEHDNGYISKYSGVKQDDLIKLGDKVKRRGCYRGNR